MPTTLTSYQVHRAYHLIRNQTKVKTLLPTPAEKENFAACSIVALEHLREEFKLLEDYQMGLITYTELQTNVTTLIENRYKR